MTFSAKQSIIKLSLMLKINPFGGFYEKDKINDDDEKFANDFARKQLINQNDYEKFIKENDFTLKKMKIFAASQDIPLFILIGRLQNDELLNWNEFNSYKIKYEIK